MFFALMEPRNVRRAVGDPPFVLIREKENPGAHAPGRSIDIGFRKRCLRRKRLNASD